MQGLKYVIPQVKPSTPLGRPLTESQWIAYARYAVTRTSDERGAVAWRKKRKELREPRYAVALDFREPR